MQILNFTASFTASFNQFAGSFQYIWFLTMADKTIFSDCLNKINTVVETHKPFVYLSLKQKKRVTISDYSCSSGNWTRTSDLRVMSPTSYLLLYPVIQLVI